MVKINVDDLEQALLLVDGPGFTEAWVCRTTGNVLIRSDELGIEQEPVPDDVDEVDKYAPVPSARRLGLGQALIFNFVQAEMPEEYDNVRQVFRRSGAYRRYSRLLDEHDMTERWYRYRDEQTRAALREWCKDQDFLLAE